MINIKRSDDGIFYLSAIISIGLYIVVCLLFLLYLQDNIVKKFDAFSKTTVLELDVIIDKPETTKDKQSFQKTIQKNKEISQEIVKKSTSVSTKQTADVKSLFATIKTSAKKVVTKEVLNIKKSTVASRYKSKFEKHKKSSDVKTSKLLDSKNLKNIVSLATEASRSKDPYYSKIYELLFRRWNPTLAADGLSATALITITDRGTFSYKILQYSGNSFYDDSLINFLNSQEMMHYPPFTKGSYTKMRVTFTSKGK